MKRRRQLPELDRRQEAAQATRDKFIGKPFDWSEGRHCVKLAYSHLREMGWRSPKLPTLPRIRSAFAARQALKDRGWDSVSAMLDDVLRDRRIPPAKMRLGDIGVVPGDEGMESIVIFLGRHAFLGWLPDGSAVVIYEANFGELSGAWRV